MSRFLLSLSLCLCSFILFAADKDAAALYGQHCASCHDSNNGQIPSFAALQALTPLAIRDALATGNMRQIGSQLDAAGQLAIAEYISGKKLDLKADSQPPLRYCERNPVLPTDFLRQPQWNGWGTDAENTRFQEQDSAALNAKDISRLKLQWVFAYPGEVLALGQANVIGGRLFVPSQSGYIYSLDASSGCAYWYFKADSSVRTAVNVGEATADSNADYLVYFTDTTANTYAVNAASGELVWKTRIDNHPAVRVTGSAQLYQGRLYVPVSTLEAVTAVNADYPCCSQRGSVVALDAGSGEILWQSYTITETPAPTTITNAHGTAFLGPSGAGIWSAPTIDSKLQVLYVGTGENSSEPATTTSDAILAMDMKDGKLLWSYQSTREDTWNAACISADTRNCPHTVGPDYDFGASPILVDLANGQRVLLAAQKSGELHALDPDNKGALLWKQQASPGGFQGGIMWGAASDGENIYVALSDRQGDQYTTADGRVDWRLQSDKGGGVHAYRIADGKLMWRAERPVCAAGRAQCSPAQAGAVSAIPGVVFAGAYDGHIRAYSSKDGRVLWDYDTVKSYDAVNGIKAQGGALDGAGPTIVNGRVYVNSGYARWGGLGGNALLVFAPE